MLCSKCGKEINDGWKVCPNCGTKIVYTESIKKSAEMEKEKSREQNINSEKEEELPKKKKTFAGCLMTMIKVCVVIVIFLVIIGIVFGDDNEDENKSETKTEKTQQVKKEKQDDEKSKQLEEVKKIDAEQEKLEEEQKQKEEEARKRLVERVTGDLKTDAENGVLFVKDSKIVDANGTPIESYSSYHVNDNGTVSNEYYVLEGVGVEENRITYGQPVEVEDNTIKVTAQEAIRYHDKYEGQRIQMYGRVAYIDNQPYLYINGKDFIQLCNYYVVDGNNDSSPTELLNDDYVKVFGTFHYATGNWFDNTYTLHTMDECIVTITDEISAMFDD